MCWASRQDRYYGVHYQNSEVGQLLDTSLPPGVLRPLLTAPSHRSQGTPSHIHVRIHDFHVRCCYRQRPPNSPPLPLLRRCLWLLSPRRRGCRLLRYVQQPLARSGTNRVLHDRLFRPLTRPFYRRLHHHKPTHGLAMDAIYCRDLGRSGIYP